MRVISVFVGLFFVVGASLAQPRFDVVLREIPFPALPALHSYAYAQHDDEVLLLAGRTEGLHKRVPWESFANAHRNMSMFVLNLHTRQVWKASIANLSASLKDQLGASNLQFYQEGDRLILVGGYGYSPSHDEHFTFPTLLSCSVSEVIRAVKACSTLQPSASTQSQPSTPCLSNTLFTAHHDERFAVTGGQLRKLNNTFMLVGGHRFDGRYNPRNGPSFVQTYTNRVLRFTLDTQGVPTFSDPMIDTSLLHRRDLNVVEQITPNGKPYLTAYAGVFRTDAEMPYLTAIDITSDRVSQRPNFSQYFNHYHCPTLPLYDRKSKQMHTIFFGGIAQYQRKDSTLIMDNEVPFTRAISCVTREKNGSTTEYALPVQMPALLGSAAEMILYPRTRTLYGKVLNLHALRSDTSWVGVLLGGIEAGAENVFWYDDETSQANTHLYEVGIVRRKKPNQHIYLNPWSKNGHQIQVYPDLDAGALALHISLATDQDVTITLKKLGLGTIIQTPKKRYKAGTHRIMIKTGEAVELGNFQLITQIGNTQWPLELHIKE